MSRRCSSSRLPLAVCSAPQSMRSVLLRLGHWARLIATSQFPRYLRVLRMISRCTCSAATDSHGHLLFRRPSDPRVLLCTTRPQVNLPTRILRPSSKMPIPRTALQLLPRKKRKMPLQATTLVMTTKLADLVLLPYLRVRSIVHDCFFRIRQSYTPKDLFFWASVIHYQYLITGSGRDVIFGQEQAELFQSTALRRHITARCALHSLPYLASSHMFWSPNTDSWLWVVETRPLRHPNLASTDSFRHFGYASFHVILRVFVNIWTCRRKEKKNVSGLCSASLPHPWTGRYE